MLLTENVVSKHHVRVKLLVERKMAVHSEGDTKMTARKATAPAPVGNMREARKEQAALRQAQAEANQRHPAGKQAPAKAPAKKPAPKKAAAAKPEQEKFVYSATARCGKTNTRASATPLTHAVDVKIAGRKGAQFAAGVIVGFYASKEAAQKVVDEINGGGVSDWSDAKVVACSGIAVSA
jgi:hypothetical protein